MTDKEKLAIYANAINKIDDLFEYRYKTYTNGELKIVVQGYLDNICKELDKL